jgi:hypothetical protein
MPVQSHQTIADEVQRDGRRRLYHEFTFDADLFRQGTNKLFLVRLVASGTDAATDRALFVGQMNEKEIQIADGELQKSIQAGDSILTEWLALDETRQQKAARLLVRFLMAVRRDENLPLIIIALGDWFDYLNDNTGAGERWENAAALATWLNITTGQLSAMNDRQQHIRAIPSPCVSAETSIDSAAALEEVID